MGKRKMRFDPRKNYERKKYKTTELTVSIPTRLLPVPAHPTELVVSLPLAVYTSSTVPDTCCLHDRVMKSTQLPPGWTVTSIPSSHPSHSTSLAVCKMQICPSSSHGADVTFMLTVAHDFRWILCVGKRQINQEQCQLLDGVAASICCVDDMVKLLCALDSSKFCVGNADPKFMQLVPRHKGTFRDKSASRIVAYHDTEAFPQPTIRHSDCELVLSREKGDRCFVCDGYRSNLHSLASREASYTTPNRTSHANYRYLSTPEKIDRLHDLHRETRAYRLKVERLQAKLASVTALHGVTLDEETTSDLHHIMLEEEEQAVQQDGFQKIFWQQHKEAASRSGESKKGMRWHPLMVRWCLFLRHQSNKCYETLRESGCIHLPSQRTLRDYTHCVQSGVGFSTEVDRLLLQAMNLMTCPEWHKLVILLLDEMHIREDLVYDKHTGKMIGFTNLGNINNHLLAFEKSMDESEEEQESGSVLAKSMMAFMVRGLFTALRFPYAQFPCASVTGDLLFEPFWHAVYRLERMGLKVLGVTFDGASVNRRLVKLHDTSNKLLYCVPNIHAADERKLFFFSDPPHLIKTTRNCWSSKSRMLWNNGSYISWQHLVDLYERDKGRATGFAMVPKLKFEHINLSSFAKMRVDLAAQVLSESVSKALVLTGGEKAQETATFVSLFDKFFDMLNVSNFTIGLRKRKPFLQPFRSSKDSRLTWLEDEFLAYLDKWEKTVQEREGFKKAEKKRMLLSDETRLGLQMTAKSFVGLVRYLFSLPEVTTNHLAFLSQNVCQDPLENFFGCQRQRGATSDNPSAQEFYKNTQALRVVNSFCRGPVKGNCRGGQSSGKDIVHDSTPLQKRQSKRKNLSKTI